MKRYVFGLLLFVTQVSPVEVIIDDSTLAQSSHLEVAPGVLDTGFDSTGKVTTAIGSDHDNGRAIAIQGDSKIVVAGHSDNGSNYDFAVMRYHSDGSLDTAFNSNGKVTTAIGSSDDYGRAIAIQGDGKIVVAGYSDNGSNSDVAVVRYHSDDSLDTGFNSSGKVTTAIGSSNDYGRAIAIQGDGKIVVAGSSNNGSNYDVAVVRYHTDGSLDTGFNSSGKVTTAVGSNNDYGRAIAIQGDGKIVVAGYSDNGSNNDFAVVRYHTDGSLDTGFNSNGKVTTAVGSSNDYGRAIAIQGDGKIVVAGYSNNGSNNDVAVVRYHTDGSLDTGFNSTGKVTTAVGSSNDNGYAVAIQGDGKIVVAGYSYNGSNNDVAVVRYHTDGSLDTGLNSTGKVTTAVGSSNDYGYAVAIQGDGKIVVAGDSDNGSNYDFAVIRYSNNISPLKLVPANSGTAG